MEGNLSDDDELPTCGICFNSYDEGKHVPLCLPCGHTMCQQCTDDILKCDSQCLCPQCRKPFNKSQVSKNIELLRSVFVIKKLKTKASTSDALQTNSKQKSSLTPSSNPSADVTICSVCDEEKKCIVCADCPNKKPLCSACFEYSHSKKSTKHHTTPWSSANMPTMCREHLQECVLFCHPCKKVICVLCVHSAAHEGHKCSPVVEEVEAAKREITVKCCELEEHTKPVQALGRQVDAVYQQLTGVSIVANVECGSSRGGSQEEGTFNTTICSIRTQFQRFREDLKRREDMLIEEAHTKKEEKVTALESQMDGISLVASKSYSVSSMTQHNLKNKGNQWVLENKAALLDNIAKNVAQVQAVMTPVAASSYLAFQVNQSGVTQFTTQIGCIASLSEMEVARLKEREKVERDAKRARI